MPAIDGDLFAAFWDLDPRDLERDSIQDASSPTTKNTHAHDCTWFSQFTINNHDTIVHHPQVYSHNRGMLNFSKLYPAAHQSQVTFLELTARVIGTFGALSDHSVPRCPAALRKVPAGGWSLSARWTPVELSDSYVLYVCKLAVSFQDVDRIIFWIHIIIS